MLTNPVEVRACVPADLPAVECLQRAWEAEGVTRGFVAAGAADLRGRLGPYFLVAEFDDGIAGFVCGSEGRSEGNAVIAPGERYVEADELYVTPEWRGRGIGGRLLDTLVAQAGNRGIERFLVYSSSRDTDAILRFYRRHGFEAWYVQMFK